MTSYLSLLSLALTFPLWSQSNSESSTAPVRIVTRTGSIGGSGPTAQDGLFLEIHNTSSKNVIGYSLDVQFVDPATSAKIQGSHGRMAARQASPLRPGDCDCSNSKPIVIKKTASGVLADPQVTLDLVVFDDGTTWGAHRLASSQQLLKELGATPTQ
jgi:hypothetical protein